MFQRPFQTTAAILALVFLAAVAPLAKAAPPSQEAVACAEAYTVQSGDWLSTIAQKYYGDVSAYTVLLNATNMAARTNDRYDPIENANRIEVGQVLCIPSGEAAQVMLAEPVRMAPAAKPAIPEAAMLLLIGNRTQANQPATVTLSGEQFDQAGRTFTLEAGDEIRLEIAPGDYRAAWSSPQHEGFGREFTALPGRVAISWIIPEKDVVYAEIVDPGNLNTSQLTTPSVTTLETPYIAPAGGKSLLAAGNRSLADIPSTLTLSGGQFGGGEAFPINPRQEVMIALAPGDYRATWSAPAGDEGQIALSRDFTVTGGKIGVIWIVPEEERAFLQRPGEAGLELE